VRQLFFGSQYPDDKLEDFFQYLAESEAMLWFLGMIPQFADFERVVQRGIVGWDGEKTDSERILVMVGELDALMDVAMMRRLAARYRQVVRESIGEKKLVNVSDVGYSEVAFTEDRENGVRLVVVKGAGHHVQNDLQWEVGAWRIADFLQQL
jgi:pimeloyl-ACP methyl ester carboxylesterase